MTEKVLVMILVNAVAGVGRAAQVQRGLRSGPSDLLAAARMLAALERRDGDPVGLPLLAGMAYGNSGATAVHKALKVLRGLQRDGLVSQGDCGWRIPQ